jgi:hypothetical protein
MHPDEYALLCDLRLVPTLAPARHSYAQSCGLDCDAGLWRLGLEPASTTATGELESDEVGHLEPAGPCRVCGTTTDRWRLVRLQEAL